MTFTSNVWEKYKRGLHSLADKFLNHHFTKKIEKKYPRSFHFFTDRFSLDKFTGLPLTFLAAAFGFNLFLLNEIVESFVNSSTIVTIDRALAQSLFSIRMKGVVQAFYYFSMFGSFWVVVGIAIISTIAFYITKRKYYIIPAWISLLCTQVTIVTGKNYFHRLRPEEFSYYKEVSYSFPSGHATVSVAFYGILFYSIIRSRRKYSSKFRWTIAAIFFIGLLGFSRLYLCVHYLSDVLAGYSLGFLWLLLAISICEWSIHIRKKRSGAQVIRK